MTVKPWPHTADCECDPTIGEPTAALARLIREDLQAEYGKLVFGFTETH